VNNSIPNQGYGFNNPLTNIPNPPIKLNIFPTINNKAPIGQIWVNMAQNTALILTSIVNNEANWQPFAGSAAFFSLTVNPGPISLTGLTDINITGSQNTNIGNTNGGAGNIAVGGTNVILTAINDLSLFASGNISLQGDTFINFATGANTIIGDSGNTSLFGNVITIGSALSAGDVRIQGAPTNINTAPGVGVVNIGNTTGNTNVFGTLTTSNTLDVTAGGASITGTTNINITGSAPTTIGTGGTGSVFIGNSTGNTDITGDLETTGTITSSAGDIIATLGSVIVVNTAGAFTLPGPASISSGAGVPANGLALHVGDIYINTTASTATTRLYIATATGSWASFTASA